MTTNEDADAFGIPYAYWDEAADGEDAVRVCPVCGERIPERTDADGECLTDNYGTHYQKVHG